MLKKRILSIVLALTMLMVPGAYAAQPAKDNMRGVWVASVHNIDFPSEQGMTADQLKAEADTELDNIAAMGLNTGLPAGAAFRRCAVSVRAVPVEPLRQRHGRSDTGRQL